MHHNSKRMALAILLAGSFLAHAENAIDEVTVYSTLDNSTLDEFSGSATISTEADIVRRNAQHLDQLALAVPNLNFSGGASRGRFAQIRGVGDIEQFVDPKAYPAVGLIVDGIELNGLFGAGLLFDAEQVEVLRGPQGTRLGASALAGSINIVSPSSDDYSHNYVQAGLGRFLARQLGGAYGGAISDELSARLSVQQYRSDGYIENNFLNRDNTGEFDEFIARTKFAWQPQDSQHALDLVLLHIDNDNGYDAFSLDNVRNKTFSDRPGFDKQRATGAALTHRLQFSDSYHLESKLTSLSASTSYGFDEDWKDQSVCVTLICPFGDFNSFDSYFRDRQDYTADVRLVSPSFTAGIYYQQSDTLLDRQRIGDIPGVFDSNYKVDRKAAYANWKPQISDRLSASVGARIESFDDDYKDSASIRSKSDDSLWSGEISLSYELNTSQKLYALASRGNKAGGVNTDATTNVGIASATAQAELADNLRFRSESLTNIEFGMLTSNPEGTLSSRLAVFYNKRINPQFETFIFDFSTFLFIGYLDNAGTAESHGLEWEGSWKATERLELDANLAYIHSAFSQYRAQDFDVTPLTFVDIASKEQPRTPSYQYHLGGKYQLNQSMLIGIQVEGRDDYEYAYYFSERARSVTLLHANIEYRTDKLTANFWMRNVLGEDYSVQGLYFGNDPVAGYPNELYTQAGEPRNMGVTLRYDLSN